MAKRADDDTNEESPETDGLQFGDGNDAEDAELLDEDEIDDEELGEDDLDAEGLEDDEVGDDEDGGGDVTGAPEKDDL